MGASGGRCRIVGIDESASVSVGIRVDTGIVAKMGDRARRAVAALHNARLGCGDARSASYQKLGSEQDYGNTSHAILSAEPTLLVYYPLAISSTARNSFTWTCMVRPMSGNVYGHAG